MAISVSFFVDLQPISSLIKNLYNIIYRIKFIVILKEHRMDEITSRENDAIPALFHRSRSIDIPQGARPWSL